MEDKRNPEICADASDSALSVDEGQPWLHDPVPAARFRGEEKESSGRRWANINRAPRDHVSGVVFKRAAHIKAVRYGLVPGAQQATADPPQAPLPLEAGDWEVEASGVARDNGNAVVRWLFSEVTGTAEGLLPGRSFGYLQDVTLEPGVAASEAALADMDTAIYVVEGCGELAHRPSLGSPVLVRPLRPGDAALIEAGERYRVSNLAAEAPLRLMVLGLLRNGAPMEDGDERG